MKQAFTSLQVIITIIAFLIAIAGLVLTILGGIDLVETFFHVGSVEKEMVVGMLAIGMLRAVDLFLIAIVFFVLSLGIMILFHNDDKLPVRLPDWLRVKDFMELKVILWEAILTTLVVSYLVGLVGLKLSGQDITISTLLLPGGILLIAISLFFLKKGEK